MLTDSICALYTAHKPTKYTYGSAAKAYIYAVYMFKVFEWNSWETHFNGNIMGKYKISVGQALR